MRQEPFGIPIVLVWISNLKKNDKKITTIFDTENLMREKLIKFAVSETSLKIDLRIFLLISLVKKDCKKTFVIQISV